MNEKTYSEIEGNAEGIIQKIRAEADKNLSDIIASAKNKAESIIKDAEISIEQGKKKTRDELNISMQRLKEIMDSSEKMEIKRIVLGRKNVFAEQVIKTAGQISADFRNKSEYKSFLISSIRKGMQLISKDTVAIKYSPKDESFINNKMKDELSELSKKNNIRINLNKDDFSDIGLVIMSEDGSIIYDARYNALFKRMSEEVYMKIIGEIKWEG